MNPYSVGGVQKFQTFFPNFVNVSVLSAALAFSQFIQLYGTLVSSTLSTVFTDTSEGTQQNKKMVTFGKCSQMVGGGVAGSKANFQNSKTDIVWVRTMSKK